MFPRVEYGRVSSATKPLSPRQRLANSRFGSILSVGLGSESGPQACVRKTTARGQTSATATSGPLTHPFPDNRPARNLPLGMTGLGGNLPFPTAATDGGGPPSISRGFGGICPTAVRPPGLARRAARCDVGARRGRWSGFPKDGERPSSTPPPLQHDPFESAAATGAQSAPGASDLTTSTSGQNAANSWTTSRLFIQPFGLCNSPANPMVASATAAAMGTLGAHAHQHLMPARPASPCRDHDALGLSPDLSREPRLGCGARPRQIALRSARPSRRGFSTC